jgi:hypothetical protein
MANTGTRETLADALILKGTARKNKGIRESLRQDDSDERRKPAWLRGIPISYNESNEVAINYKAEAAGVELLPYPDAKPLPGDNGERFLSVYKHEQDERNKLNQHPLNDRCQCERCAGNQTPLPHEIAKAVRTRGVTQKATTQTGTFRLNEDGTREVWNGYSNVWVKCGNSENKRRKVEVEVRKLVVSIDEHDDGAITVQGIRRA